MKHSQILNKYFKKQKFNKGIIFGKKDEVYYMLDFEKVLIEISERDDINTLKQDVKNGINRLLTLKNGEQIILTTNIRK